MKKVIDLIAKAFLYIVATMAMFFACYLVGLSLFSFIFIIHAIPIILFALSREEYVNDMSIKQAETVQAWCIMVSIIITITIFSEPYKKVETYLDSKLLNGSITTQSYPSQDEDGRDTETIVYNFSPTNKSDKIKQDLISWWFLIIVFGCPVYSYFGTKRILKKVKNINLIEERKEYNYL